MKVKRAILILIFIFMFIPLVYAASTVTEVSNINNVPAISGKRSVYIIDSNDYTIDIRDTANFKVMNVERQRVIIYNKPTSDTTYDHPFSVTWRNAGYYIDNNGDTKMVNVIADVTKLDLDLPNDSYSDPSAGYYIASADATGFFADMYPVDSSGEIISTSRYPGNHMYISFKVVNTDGSSLNSSITNNMMIPWIISDLDIDDKTVGAVGNGYTSDNTYRESIKFMTGFSSTFYVLEGTVLDITDNNTKFSATEPTGNDGNGTGQKDKEYSTVVGYQTSPTATVEWWGSDCGTAIRTRANVYDYPEYVAPVKSTSQSYHRIGDYAKYTVSQKFPKTIAANKAKKIELSDTFDSAFDISAIEYQVLDNNSRDVTSEWTKTISGQKVTLTYSGSDITKVEGTYKFIFNKLKILEPSSSHTTVYENQINYKVIPNKATIAITSLNDTTTNKDTNNVDIRVYYSNLELIKESVYNESTDPKVGDSINYKFTITNYGGSTLSQLTLIDQMKGIVIDSGMQDTLAAGESITVYGHYVLTADDIKDGNIIENTATVTGIDPSGNVLTSTDNAVVEIIVNPQTGIRNYVILAIEALVACIAVYMLIIRKRIFK